MTDEKEIIVDSIDVSECEFLWKEKLPKRFCNNGNLDCDCNSNLNCYFKQLKRKEQECEELKEKLRECRIGIKDISIESTEICKISEKYKRVLDEIRKIIVKMSTKTILTFPDFTREENLKGVMKQCCSGYIEILNIINKAKAVNNDR
jgi:hypothetical protein